MNILENQILEANRLKKIMRDFKIEIQDRIILSDDITENERILQEVTNKIRRKWIKTVTEITSEYNLAPWKGQVPLDLYGNEIKFTYEPLLNDVKIAKQFEYDNFRGEIKKTVLYNNGMAAIRGTIDIIDILIKERICIKKSVGYFETRIYLESLINRGIETYELEDKENKNCNVYIFEPIKYLLSLEVTNIEILIEEINSSCSKIIFVIMDSTMHNYNELFEGINKELKSNKKNVVFIDVRSGIKMDQQGLEIGNLGVATWYVHKKNSKYAKMLFDFIDHYKGILGDNISYNKLVSLEMFSSALSRQYSRIVHTTAFDFAHSIVVKSNKYIKQVIYPELKYKNENLVMPFLFIKFDLKNAEEYNQLLENIVGICATEGLVLPYRNSFGFRYPSIEYIYDYRTDENVIKLYLGVYKGGIYEFLLNIINTLGGNDNPKIENMICKKIKRWEQRKCIDVK